MSTERADTVHYEGPSGRLGLGAGISRIFGKEWATPLAGDARAPEQARRLHVRVLRLGEARRPHPFEFCENGAKATLWELTTRRCTPDFFAKHTVTELRGLEDHDLEQQGRLTHPMRYDPAHRSLRAVSNGTRHSRRSARAQGARSEVRRLLFLRPGQPRNLLSIRAVRPALRQQQPARQLQHVPRDDIGGAEEGHRRRRRHGRVRRLRQCDAMFFFGQNTGSNSPRFLHPLQEAAKRGVRDHHLQPGP